MSPLPPASGLRCAGERAARRRDRATRCGFPRLLPDRPRTCPSPDNTEYWKVTDASGIQYFFGKHRMPGWSDKGTTATTVDDPVTNSVWTVPVFGDDSGEPCY